MSAAAIIHDSFPPGWTPAFEALRTAPRGTVCLILGAQDRDGADFAVRAGGILSTDGSRVAVIDADIVCSELSYPGTVSVAWAADQFTRLDQLTPVSQHFVGSFSPEEGAMELIACLAQVVNLALSSDADRVLVCLPGRISGPFGRRLTACILQSTSTTLILAFGDPSEFTVTLSLVSALRPFTDVMIVPTRRLQPSGTSTQRRLRQRARLFRAIGNGQEVLLPLSNDAPDAIKTLNSNLGTAEVLQPHLIRWISKTLGLNVVRAELARGRRLDLYVNDDIRVDRFETDSAAAIVGEHFNTSAIRQIPMSKIVGTYVGLIGEKGKLLGVGRFEGIDTATQELRIRTSVNPNQRVRVVQFGQARISEDGSTRINKNE